MKIADYLRISILSLLLMSLFSCSNDDEPEAVYNAVKVEIESSSDQTIQVTVVDGRDVSKFDIHGDYSETFKTDKNEFMVMAVSLDLNTTFTIKVWINDTLVKEVTGSNVLTTEFIPLPQQ